ncbi:MAG: TonB-dependent receptor [Acidobacteriaceae bacterium]|nr:TonB-dependent receptor [Acidobacteriaceae bacterium]
MKSTVSLTLFVCLLAALAIAQTASLHGVVTDPSGAVTPNAIVQLTAPAGDQRSRTDAAGQYSFPSLKPGSYTVRVIAKGFTLHQEENVAINGPVSLNVQLSIEAEAQVVNVESDANAVSTDPTQNAAALVLGEKELAALSDDPDELSQQLQSMAGPAAGPSGGQIYIDGFTGGNMPPKSSIREVRINSNPFSPEYDRPGFGRIEILTKPGSGSIHGQGFAQYNDQDLNTRSPLLATSLPPYSQKFFGVNLTGPIKANKASFTFDFERRMIQENALVLATKLDSNLNPLTVNEAVVTPQTRMTISPRLDYTINDKNTLTVRFQQTHIELDKQGVGNFNLPSQAYNQKSAENTVQATETNIISPRAINETRLQYMHSGIGYTGNNSIPTINVAGAFADGGAQIGNSATNTNRLELTNISTLTRGTHTFKFGARVRNVWLDDTSVNNFGGTYTFFGGTGPELDANNQPIPGTSIQLSGLESYRRTLLFQSLGYSAADIRSLGGGASQFSLSAGTPTTRVSMLDAGVFFNDDWRIRPNLTISYGVRYELQTHLSDHTDISPRLGIAWGIDAHNGRPAKTVLRLGFGDFFDRLTETSILSAARYNGIAQQSYLLLNPDTFPVIPSAAMLASSKQPQQIQLLYSGLKAPRMYQWSAGLDRQVNKYFRLSANYIGMRGDHAFITRNINTPVNGVYPYGDQELRLLTESTGYSRTNMFIVSPNFNYKKIFLFGFYGLSYGMSTSETAPSNPYNLNADYGPSTFGDVRHRFLLGSSIPLPWRVMLNPFMMVSSGAPYNITTGRDVLGTGFATQRPALLNLTSAQCQGGSLLYEAAFGCFDLAPTAGENIIEKNYGRGPVNLNFNMRLSRTWSFGNRGESGVPDSGGPPPGMGGARGGPGPGGPGGGGPPGGGPGGPGGPPPGMFGGASGKKYNLTLSLSARNILNHPSYAAPVGNLSSPYFGESTSLAGFGPLGGNSSYDRKIDVQLRFQF